MQHHFIIVRSFLEYHKISVRNLCGTKEYLNFLSTPSVLSLLVPRQQFYKSFLVLGEMQYRQIFHQSGTCVCCKYRYFPLVLPLTSYFLQFLVPDTDSVSVVSSTGCSHCYSLNPDKPLVLSLSQFMFLQLKQTHTHTLENPGIMSGLWYQLLYQKCTQRLVLSTVSLKEVYTVLGFYISVLVPGHRGPWSWYYLLLL